MPRRAEPCKFCGGPRPSDSRRKVRDPTTGAIRQLAACYTCRGIAGLDVPPAYRFGPEYTAEAGTPSPVACLQVADSRQALADVHGVRLFFGDPPYNIGFPYEGYEHAQPRDAYLDMIEAVLRSAWNAALPGASFVVVHYPEGIADAWPQITAAWRFHRWLTWSYTDRRGDDSHGPPRQSRAMLWLCKGSRPHYFRDRARDHEGQPWGDVWRIHGKRGSSIGQRGYGTQIPDELLRRWIYTTTNPGDLVADPWAGSGSTARVALGLNRRAWACDVNPRCAAFWTDMTGPEYPACRPVPETQTTLEVAA